VSTTHQKPPTRGRIAAAIMLTASGALVAGALGPAAPANAAGTYVALAYQQSYGFGGNSSIVTPTV
jgi:hypothetical protein